MEREQMTEMLTENELRQIDDLLKKATAYKNNVRHGGCNPHTKAIAAWVPKLLHTVRVLQKTLREASCYVADSWSNQHTPADCVDVLIEKAQKELTNE
jgi:hypothetical protein